MDINMAKQQVIRAGKDLLESGLIVRTWGNISCRIDDKTFVITPSGRTYDSLIPDDIVECRIEDASYDGDIKPSSEKRIHALVYQAHCDANFVIHTHQPNASAVSASRLKTMPVDNFSALGDRVPVASYGLPGTKALSKGVEEALKQTKGLAVIMSNHGALTFGKDYVEAFLAAKQLEEASFAFVRDTYLKAAGSDEYLEHYSHSYYLSLATEQPTYLPKEPVSLFCSKRTNNGFIIEDKKYHFVDKNLPSYALIHSAIYQDRKDINFIEQDISHGLLPVSLADKPLRPLLDDFAQIVGRSARCSKSLSPEDIVRSLKKRSGVLIPGAGALCCAATQSDAHAVSLVMQKNALAEIAATILGSREYIGLFDCVLMHFVYTQSYAKKAKK